MKITTAEKNENAESADIGKSGKTIHPILKSAARIVIVTVILWLVLTRINTPYIFQAPGSCEDTSLYVKVADAPSEEAHGSFYLTTVIYEPASLLLYIWGKLDPDTELKKRNREDEDIPFDIRNEYMAVQMEESKIKAQVAAMKALGYDFEVERTPVQIIEVLEWSKAGDFLKQDDVILEVGGNRVKTEMDVKFEDKDTVAGMKIKRGKEELELEIPLTRRNNETKVGIIAMSRINAEKLPIRIDIKSDNIVGESAGLMFCLEIMKQISQVDLTGGYQIAGTGVIDENGNVWPIEGARYKVKASIDNGADYFFSPEKNYREARRAAGDNIRVYSVKTLQDALDILKEINPDADIAPFVQSNKREQEKDI